ncbi:MAG: Chaperone of endosialidase [Solirubrobacteraceae bacterium]|nr:Chaperone of endosialidase [Solirubrobacteraceae bacterium]
MGANPWRWPAGSDSEPLDAFIRRCNTRLGRLTTTLGAMLGDLEGVDAFRNGDTTPSVAGARTFTVANSVGVTITRLDDGQPGDIRTIWATTANTTLQHSAALFLLAGANVTMGANETRTFGTVDGVNWRELQAPIAAAGSASTLSPGRTINGVLFDGSANITVPAAAGTLTGATLNATVTSSSLTVVGVLASPHMTSPVVDSGGLTATGQAINAGNLFTTLQQALTLGNNGNNDVWLNAAAAALRVLVSGGASPCWSLDQTGQTVNYGPLVFALDNTKDIGLVAANRPRTIYAATSVVTGTLTGVLSTAAQPNVTSLGSLSSLTVTGASSLAWQPTPTRLTADNAAIAAATPTTGVAVATLQQAVGLNEEWDIEWILHVANSVATDVFVVNVAPTAGTFTGRVTVIGQNGVPTAGAGVAKILQGPAGTITTATANAPGNTGTIGLVTTIIVRAQGKQTVAGGTLQVQLRAGTSAAVSSGTATVKAQSQMIATRLA